MIEFGKQFFANLILINDFLISKYDYISYLDVTIDNDLNFNVKTVSKFGIIGDLSFLIVIGHNKTQ